MAKWLILISTSGFAELILFVIIQLLSYLYIPTVFLKQQKRFIGIVQSNSVHTNKTFLASGTQQILKISLNVIRCPSSLHYYRPTTLSNKFILCGKLSNNQHYWTKNDLKIIKYVHSSVFKRQ